MVSPLVFGVAASLPLVVGAALGAYWGPPKQVTATGLAFASGALIIALAFELFEPAFSQAGLPVAGGGLLAGAVVFTLVDWALQTYAGDTGGWALLASVVLDGVPENAALGVVLVGATQSGPLALLAGIAATNFPESMGGAQDMRENQGLSNAQAVAVWTLAAAVLAAAVVLGNLAFAGHGERLLGVVRAFAGGAVLSSIASEILPDAYEEGGPLVALATAAGFLLTFALK